MTNLANSLGSVSTDQALETLISVSGEPAAFSDSLAPLVVSTLDQIVTASTSST